MIFFYRSFPSYLTKAAVLTASEKKVVFESRLKNPNGVKYTLFHAAVFEVSQKLKTLNTKRNILVIQLFSALLHPNPHFIFSNEEQICLQ